MVIMAFTNLIVSVYARNFILSNFMASMVSTIDTCVDIYELFQHFIIFNTVLS